MTEVVVPIEQYERGRDRVTSFARTDTNTLMATEFAPIRWIVPDYVPEGFSVLAGRQKLGKTWLAIDWALSVAAGAFAMGSISVELGDVLYLDLENGPRRIQRRLRQLFPSNRDFPDLSRLTWQIDAPPLDKGFIGVLDDWRQSVSNPRLVVIDVLQRIKPIGSTARNSYENDYAAWAPLQAWATRHAIAVVGLHHTRKGGADDPLEALSGSNGLSACADTTLVLDKDGNGTTLYVRGRDVDEKESAMAFSSGLWTLAGDASVVRTSSERQAILEVLFEQREAMSPTEVSAATGMSTQNVRQALHRMCRKAEIKRIGRGQYLHPDFDTSVTGCHTVTITENLIQTNHIRGNVTS